jgi:small subunit ribosomal protein S1
MLKNSLNGDEHEAKVVTVIKKKKMSLSIKQMTEDPWSTIENKYPEKANTKVL